ncbi:RhoGAP domain-containing protein, partial [Salmonella sp. s51228]|uniref:RhoGAP domain-containing protein n=1 Tax=Salmonella sp. s51228 TaxID=3159652 RepID=UPI00397FB862
GGFLSKQQANDLFTAIRQKNINGVVVIIHNSNNSNQGTTRNVLFLLSKVCEHSDVNLMTPGNLATSCGPSLFPSINSGNATLMTKNLIDVITTLFPDY